MFVCGIWCLADVSSVSPSSEQTQNHPKITFEPFSEVFRTLPKISEDLPKISKNHKII